MRQKTIKTIEDFLMVKSDKIEKSPLIFAFGFPKKELAEEAARLYKKGFCKCILIAGKGSKNPDDSFDKPLKNIAEADWHKEKLIKLGVPPEIILTENRSTNTLENVVFSKSIIKHRFGKIPRKIIVLCKVFHGQRCLMTLRKNLSGDTKYIMRPIENKDHAIKNWWKNKRLRNHLLDEIRKIGEYALKGDLTWE